MPLDATKLEEYRRLAAEAGAAEHIGYRLGTAMREALPALITEVQRLLHHPVRRWNVRRAEGNDLVVCRAEHEKAEGCREERFVPAAEADRLRSLLRELEWGCEGCAPLCPSCGAYFADKPIHDPGCRLAAALAPPSAQPAAERSNATEAPGAEAPAKPDGT